MNQPSSQQSLLITVLIVIVGFVGGYLYNSSVGSMESVPTLPAAANESFKRLKDLKINFDLLNDPLYKALQINGQFPVDSSSAGKRDPFVP